MKRSYLSLPLAAGESRLRLTMAGQRALREKWDQDVMQLLLTAATEPEILCDLLTQALNWPDSGNPITDGAALYDALVDEGWQGQAAFAALAFDLGSASGLLTRDQAKELTAAVSGAYDSAFAALGHE